MSSSISNGIKLIGITGKAGAGKDYIANLIRKKYGYFCIAFADHMKCEMMRNCGFSFSEVYTEKTPDSRIAMQQFGMHERENSGINTWVDTLASWIDVINLKNNIGGFVVTDVRFDNEAEFIKNNNGILIEVVSDSDRDDMTSDAKKHASEQGVNKSYIDHSFNNKIGTTNEEIFSFLEELNDKYSLILI